jgi:DNA polymerase-3 subunit delta
LEPFERDFNQYTLYASDTNCREIIDICSRFPMMAQRQLVIVKEAQSLKKAEELIPYLENPSATTVLVLCFNGKNADKRTTFYKTATKYGFVFESAKVPEEGVPKWIEQYLKSLSKSVDGDAAMLIAECTGNDLRKIVLEVDKLIKSLPETTVNITASDVEKIIGISREFNITELTNAIAFGNAEKGFKIAYFFGESPKQYPLPKTLGFLFFFFWKLEQIHAYCLESPRPSLQDAAARAGLYYKSAASYIAAAQRYPLRKTMKIISHIIFFFSFWACSLVSI